MILRHFYHSFDKPLNSVILINVRCYQINKMVSVMSVLLFLTDILSDIITN